jgi:ActR/RegA family two-component response regulator
MGDPLTGHVILIADPRAQRFVRDLQGALEQRGAETLIAQEPADAIDRAREFRFSVAVINCDDASDALRKLIHDLGDIPILLYGSEAASAASKTVGPHLALARSNVESITGALGGLLGADRH